MNKNSMNLSPDFHLIRDLTPEEMNGASGGRAAATKGVKAKLFVSAPPRETTTVWDPQPEPIPDPEPEPRPEPDPGPDPGPFPV